LSGSDRRSGAPAPSGGPNSAHHDPVEGTALVTGGSSGLGLSTALALAAAGWHTVIAARDTAGLDRAVADAAAEGLALHPFPADVTDEDSVGRLFEELTRHPPLRVCVNNAGRNVSHRLVAERGDGNGGRLLVAHPLDRWERTLRLCLTGTFLVGRAAALSMVADGEGGVIVNISSATSSGAYAQSAYAAAKAGVESLTRTWAVELGEHGIRVVAVVPGVMDGPALRRRSAADPRHAEYMSRLREQIPLGRWCSQEDVAAAVVFATQNSSLTGTAWEVHGGGVPPRVHR
jgi:3-oxoacyl-[acyl-carrier protein] reductase